MVQEKDYFAFISDKRKSLPAANCRCYSNVECLRSSFAVPLVCIWLSNRALKWIRSSFEEGSKDMSAYTQLTNMSSMVYEVLHDMFGSDELMFEKEDVKLK